MRSRTSTAVVFAAGLAIAGCSSSGSTPADFKVTTLMITPPNTFSHADLAWPQAVLLQDGATHPGTFIAPVVSGS
jgi:hypothetical protein